MLVCGAVLVLRSEPDLRSPPSLLLNSPHVYHDTDGWMLLVRQKLYLNHKPSLKIQVMKAERTGWISPTCSIFENRKEHFAQLNSYKLWFEYVSVTLHFLRYGGIPCDMLIISFPDPRRSGLTQKNHGKNKLPRIEVKDLWKERV